MSRCGFFSVFFEVKSSPQRTLRKCSTNNTEQNTEFTKEKEQQQIEVYKMCFELFRKHKESISAITFWNISDRHSWLDNFPVRNRKDYPLLFDKDLKEKKVYWEVVKF